MKYFNMKSTYIFILNFKFKRNIYVILSTF